MKKIFTSLIIVIMISFANTLQAQELKRPLTAKIINEAIPDSIPEGKSWVKGHWSWDGGRYLWEEGSFTDTKIGAEWIDGEWERNNSSGWWKYNEGYWRKISDETDVENDKNTAEKDKKSKEKRHQNKTSGFFIKTGNSE